MNANLDRGAPKTLGDWIRHYRLRQRQIHTDTPWAQEDLAVAIWSDKSHVNRIERGHAVPTRRTLERICEALALSWPERAQLLGLGGYFVDFPSPTSADIERVAEHSAKLLAASAYPICLMDRDYRIWDLNELHARCWLGFVDRAAALEHVRGLSTVDKLLDPLVSAWWQAVIVDFDAYARRALTRFQHSLSLRSPDASMDAIVQRIEADPRYNRLWREISSAGSGQDAPAFLDHQMVVVDHPQLGRYRILIWHTSLTTDERFFLSHHVPADGASQALFEHLAVRMSDRDAWRSDPGGILRSTDAAPTHADGIQVEIGSEP